ncbi:MAG: phage portal protein [Planctomycetota bacterium]|jgi:lambda family phage portal protein
MRRSISILDKDGRPIARRPGRPTPRGQRPLEIQRAGVTYGWTGRGYRAVEVATYDGRAYTTFSGDQHLAYHRRKLVSESRDFQRNNAIYIGMIDRAVNYIVGDGFRLQVKTSSKETNRLVEGMWRNWWKKPEIRGLLSGDQVEQMVCRELLVAGDLGILKTKKATIRLVESEQIAHTKLLDGIDKDELGTPQRYYICPYSSSGRPLVHKAKGVAARDILFVVNPQRPSQTRGVPVFQPAFPMIHRLNDVCDSEAIGWQLLARFALSVLREQGPNYAHAESTDDPQKEGEDTTGDITDRITELEYAIIFHGQPGEELKGVDHNIPGKDFGSSIRMFLRLIGLPMGIPLEVILLDWTKSNYSQSRAVLEQAFQTFSAYQRILEKSFYDPLLAWNIERWAAELPQRGLEQLRRGIKRDGTATHEWIRPSWPWLDQKKEAEAQGAKLDRALTTHAHVCKSLKLDRDDVVQARQQEVTDAIEIAKKIEAATDQKVPWQIFCGLEANKVAANPAPGPAPTQGPDNDDEKGGDE